MKIRYIIVGIITGLILYLCYCTTGKNISTSYQILGIIAILSYLFLLKIVSYLCYLKTEKQVSIFEIIFLTIFFIMLFIPMLHIDKSKISKTENRTLATYPKLLTPKKQVDNEYGLKFDKWFNDRFYLRNAIINSYLKFQLNIKDYIVLPNKSVFNKKNNWMIAGAHLTFSINKAQEKTIIDTLNKFDDFCQDNNIKLYVLIAPTQGDIYYDKVYPHVNRNLKKENEKIIKQIQKNTKAKVVFPIDRLKKQALNNYVYFKVDHHWTDYGAYIGYQELMNMIKQDFPSIKTVSLDDYDKIQTKKIRSDFNREYYAGHTLKYSFSSYLDYSNRILDTKYDYYNHHDQQNIDIQSINKYKDKEKVSHYQKGNNLKVLELGTSMNENLLGFTQYTFKDLKYIRINNVKGVPTADEFKIMKYNKNKILEYKPNILIFCIATNQINNLKDMFLED